jgi:nitrite reductase/ring-hydroxylating ferredoxin subunit
VGLVHAALNTTALALFVGSYIARRSGTRGAGVALSTTGYAIAAVSAFLGGEMVYGLGTGVSRNAWNPVGEGFTVAADAADVKEGQLTGAEIEVDGQRQPLVLFKQGARIYALSGVCSHWGGPLAEGKLVQVDGVPCVECPWHGSQFRLRDGGVERGPASTGQPVYETRLSGGKVEVRRVPAGEPVASA